MEYHDRGTPLVSVQKFFNRNLRYSCKCFWFITFVKKSEPGGLAFSRKHALCQSQSPLWRVSVLLKTAGCGRVSSGSGIWPKYSVGFGKTPGLLTGNGICPLLGERDVPLQTSCAYSNSFNSSNAGRFFWSWILKRLYQSLGKEKESRCVVFTSWTKCEIREFRVAVVQRRQRNVQKSVMHVQSCCFAI